MNGMEKREKANMTVGESPLVSVILPVRNEAHYIARSLGAVLAQDYPASLMEVLVVDGMSTDGTREIVESFKSRFPRVRLIDNPGQIVPTGLNAATARARGAILVRVDGHCEIERDYVSRCVGHLQNDGVDGVGGPIQTIGESFAARDIAVAMSSTFGVGDSAFRTVTDKTMLTDTVAFPAYTRGIVERVGPYDEELTRNQDDDYNYRLRKIGAKVLLAADVRSRYYSRSSIRSLWRQYFQYGYWKVRVMQKHPRQMRPRQFAPPLFVASLSLSLLAAPWSAIGALMLGMVAGSYVIANFAASFLAARNRGQRPSWLLPVAFATLHIGYGLGFLIGLIRFWNRWGDHGSRRSGQAAAPA
jgi:succinoglycan biosynthesis protein ExoA